MKLHELKSVGSWIDLDNGVVYPSYANGSVDLECPTSLKYDVLSEEWYSKLSNSDHEVINEFIPYLKLDKKK
jgi:hypothetical protein